MNIEQALNIINQLRLNATLPGKDHEIVAQAYKVICDSLPQKFDPEVNK